MKNKGRSGGGGKMTKAKDKSGVNKPVKQEVVVNKVVQDKHANPTQKQKL